ncbi:hypothetical protein K438DRAFT_1759889 [Mycena galopus ATCC 62051]|nr:hypothetical protein K438DRAFT_1759889 [Mycena galopus ATCC 62051]
MYPPGFLLRKKQTQVSSALQASNPRARLGVIAPLCLFEAERQSWFSRHGVRYQSDSWRWSHVISIVKLLLFFLGWAPTFGVHLSPVPAPIRNYFLHYDLWDAYFQARGGTSFRREEERGGRGMRAIEDPFHFRNEHGYLDRSPTREFTTDYRGG